MNNFVYMLKVPEDPEVFKQVARNLLVQEVPEWIRISTLAPITTLGYKPGSEGALLAWTESGITYGVPNDPSTPRTFVPWQNIAFIAEGDIVVEQQAAAAAQIAAESEPVAS